VPFYRNAVTKVFGFLWLGPAITLLVFYFKGHIIGAGIGCRGNGCRVDPYSTDQVEQVQKLDKKNRDILGALQLVAKALELWFMFVAADLVYSASLWVAWKNALPLSMKSAYAEFLDLIYLIGLPSQLWKTRPAATGNTVSSDNNREIKRRRQLTYCFTFVVAVLCIVANLMGPAIAVLVLPTLQWIDINSQEHVVFVEMASSSAPNSTAVATGCSEEELATGSYSCTGTLYAANLDGLTSSAISTLRQRSGRGGLILPPAVQEDDLTFSFNVTKASSEIWVPNRQVLRELSIDLDNFNTTTTMNAEPPAPDYSQSYLFNRSLETRLQRQGPTIGLRSSCSNSNATVFSVAENREVRCYPLSEDPTQSKCIRLGDGWAGNPETVEAQFTIQDIVEGFNVTTTIYATDHAAYLNNPPCPDEDKCEWDTLFAEPPSEELKNMTGNQQIFEYVIPTAENNVWCDASQYLSFATYLLNPSPLANILNLVELQVLDASPSLPPEDYNNAAAQFVHPDWNLAAWSVDRGGVVDGNRGAALVLIDSLKHFLNDQGADPAFLVVHQYSVMQALSMVPYATRNITTDAERSIQNKNEKDNPKLNSTLKFWATVQLWKYGSDSRTAKLGVTVILLGCICATASILPGVSHKKSVSKAMDDTNRSPSNTTTTSTA
jgi:hypothetical protein